MLISICLCTFNRAKLLDRALETLSEQKGVDFDLVEIIIVDNNSLDETAEIADNWARSLPLRRVAETRQGLSHARNCALREATGDWIIFMDDDVLLDPAWLRAYIEAFNRFPTAEFAGGRIVPHWEDHPPAWFRGEHLALLDGLLVWYDLGGDDRVMSPEDPEPFGASFAVLRKACSEIGQFRPDLGVNGLSPGRGEETEFLWRMREAGRTGVYVHRALCHHLADPRRFTLRSLYHYGIASGKAYRAIVDPQASGSKLKGAEFLARGLFQLLKGRGDRFRQCVINAGIQAGLVSHE